VLYQYKLNFSYVFINILYYSATIFASGCSINGERLFNKEYGMPRTQEFDRSDVLDKALSLFWSDGYEASSISKLLGVMDLNRGSLYLAFRDKSTLFKEVLGHYFQDCLSGLFIPTLIEIDNPAVALREFFYRGLLYNDVATNFKGCLLCNTVSELSNTNPDIAGEANNYLLQLRDLFLQRLIEAKAMGMIGRRKDIDKQADFLLGVLAGLRLQCKMGFDREALKSTIDTALDSIFYKENNSKKH
jgi:TetR/AcrR family transcriptional regulator, transcriptional repressor for nem operon